jgi:hypothetical protein
VNRAEVVERAKANLARAYDEAAELIALYLKDNPREKLQSLCKEIDPDNWNALRVKVQRAQTALEANEQAVLAARRTERARKDRSAAKTVLRDPEQRKQVIENLTPDELGQVEHAIEERREREFPSPTRSTPRPGEDVGTQLRDLMYQTNSRLGRVLELLVDADLDRELIEHLHLMAEGAERKAQHVQEVLDGTADFNEEIARFLND